MVRHGIASEGQKPRGIVNTERKSGRIGRTGYHVGRGAVIFWPIEMDSLAMHTRILARQGTFRETPSRYPKRQRSGQRHPEASYSSQYFRDITKRYKRGVWHLLHREKCL